jgi:hypothetical protein
MCQERVGFFFLWFALLSLLLLAWVNHTPSSYLYPLVQSKYIYFPLLTAFCYSGIGKFRIKVTCIICFNVC